LLLSLVLLTAPRVSSAHVVEGIVRGGAQIEGITVLGLVSRNIHRGAEIIAAYAAVTEDGKFKLTWDGPKSLWLVVSRQAAESSLDELLRAPLVMAAHMPVIAGDADVILQVPSNEMTQSLWRGEIASNTPLAVGGSLLIVVLSLLGWWLRRRPDAPSAPSAQRSYAVDWRFGGMWFVGALAVFSLNVGSEPFDLLEYSYFHEGSRPDSVTAVLEDSISAELAHGPVTPLVNRGMASLSTSPWVVRSPSVLFGALFVWFVWSITASHLGTSAGHLAAAFALGAPIVFFYSRDATPYALTGLLAVVSAWLALRGSRATKPQLWWLVFSAVQVVGFFAHYGYAFFSAALGLTLIAAWWKRRPHALSYALFAFAFAAILPVMRADSLFTMLELSGARFALMSPVYPQSPGLPLFVTQFLTVLTGLPEWLSAGLFVVVPLWCIGLMYLRRASGMLAWFSVIQVALLLVWLVFSHTMSVDYGGGRVFYAYRWTRPLFLGVLLPFAGLALQPVLRWIALVLVTALLCTTVASAFDAKRPSIDRAAAYLEENAQQDDAWAVLPAAFYGDPVLYALHKGSPPSLITGMQTFDSEMGSGVIRGPLAETYQPFETAIDRLAYGRVWVFEFAESMFGTPKFDPAVIRRTRAALEAEGWSLDEEKTFANLTLRRYTCGLECEWLGKRTFAFRPHDRLMSERYLVTSPGPPFPAISDTSLSLVFPRATGTVTARWPATISGGLQFRDMNCQNAPGVVTCRLHPGTTGRTRTVLNFTGDLTSGDIVVEVSR
jgi:hypothetical protein